MLVDMEGYPVAEAAEILEAPSGTVKSRCARGRARLAVLLADLDLGPDDRNHDGRAASHPGDPPGAPVTTVGRPARAAARAARLRQAPTSTPTRR